jgi:hypothetical protein
MLARLGVSALLVSALITALTDSSGLVPTSALDVATYYTVQANIVAVLVWSALVFYAWRQASPPRWLEYGRAFSAANLVTVAVIYWLAIAPLGLQHGGGLVYVMLVSHVVSPLYASAEHLVVGPREPLPWRHLWALCAYPALWVGIAVARSATGGPVIYAYLDPDRGALAIVWALTWNLAVLLAATAAAMRVRRWRRWSDAVSATGRAAASPAPTTRR